MKITKTTYWLFAAALCSAIWLSACGNAGSGRLSDREIAEKAYRMGQTDAAEMLDECHTQSQINSRLLDIRARITNIKSHMGESAAIDYENGFKNTLIEHGDTLANLLFD